VLAEGGWHSAEDERRPVPLPEPITWGEASSNALSCRWRGVPVRPCLRWRRGARRGSARLRGDALRNCVRAFAV